MQSPSKLQRRVAFLLGLLVLCVGTSVVLTAQVAEIIPDEPITNVRAPVSVLCGDGVKGDDEECDDGNGANSDSCTIACTLAKCGDGFYQPFGLDGIQSDDDEQCDDGSNNGSEDSECSTTCRYVASKGEKRLEQLQREQSLIEQRIEESLANTIEVDQQTVRSLYCFDRFGDITQNREECDTTQLADVLPKHTLNEAQIHNLLRKQFISDAEIEAVQKDLARSMQLTYNKIQSILDNAMVPTYVVQYFKDSLSWLQDSINYLSAKKRSASELSTIKKALYELIKNIQSLLLREDIVDFQRGVLEDLLQRTQSLILEFRKVITTLTQADIDVDENIVNSIDTAGIEFTRIREICIQNVESCKEIESILNALSEVEEPLLNILRDHPEVMQSLE